MEKQQKKRIKKYISWFLIVAVVALLAVMPLIAAKDETAEGPLASILSGTAERTSISSVLIGGGTLSSQETAQITIPAAVQLTEYFVGNGDMVEAGDAIAAVDRVTVMTAITQVQETLHYLAEEIDAVSGDEASDEVIAQAGGTVKVLYAQEGESVRDVMLEHGALAVLSLDGLMAVQVERATDLTAGETVCVTLSDGTETDGRVESNLNGILTVTLSDAGYSIGESVKLTTEDGDRIGSGTLYIHNQWNAVAYSGTISQIRVSEGDTVSAGRTLIQLEDTGHTAQFYALSSQHREYEELMLTLFQMYQSETITAPKAGVVSGVDQDGAYMLSDDGTGWTLTLLANAPNGDDETAYQNHVGQVTSVGIDGLVLKMNPQPLSITDYMDLSSVPLDTALMTEDVIHAVQAPIYQLAEGEWVQLDPASIASGDILLFAFDANGVVWVVRAGSAALEPEAPEETEPTQPVEPSEPTEPEDPEDPEDPETPSEPEASDSSTGSSQQGGSMGDMGGSAVQPEEEAYTLYGLDTVTIASVTPQDNMTLEVTIDELDISRVYVGQSANLSANALPGQVFQAMVTQIGNTGESDGGNSKFTVELTLEKYTDMLPGMTASVVITLDTVDEVLSVPVAALVEEGSQTLLYTSYDEKTGELGDPVTVTVGISDGENAQILSGISEGTAFYYPFYDTLVISDTPEQGGFPFGNSRS